ncbi:glycosyltransferase family 2 protein [Microbacterium sp. JZ31]|uniref:glycosyltransferase family 2 protein n=1 Tax=Microbacterium sp. JZ31 TaxID=1906274 RepID=UPI0019345858|nr:glycosyltransferase family A protein [Microbacterium sp. JZ31]
MSVIVPVYNPGPGLDDLIASLDKQTLGRHRLEVLLCDDGSDEATRERLRRIASSRPHVRVLELERTGWPGTPRNHGIDAARGAYLFFADQDDRVFTNGLRDMAAFADAHGSDVVVGKVVGVGRAIPGAIFRRDVPSAVLGRDPLLELLTPHKLFRTSFVRDNGIRFPDGRVRLEDHQFVMQAYFAARTISILASRPCYAWLKNEGSASSSRIDPGTYFPHLERVLEIVERNTDPGPLRDTLLRHWYRGKILKRLDTRRLLRYPEDYRARFLDAVEPLARRWFGEAVDAGLPMPMRVRSALLRAGRRDDLLRLAEFESGLECRAELRSARWRRDGALVVTLDATIGHRTESAAALPGIDGSSAVWRPPAAIGIGDLDESTLDATRDLRGDRIRLHLKAGRRERRMPGRDARRMAGATVVVEPLSVFPWRDSSEGGRVTVHALHAGWDISAPLRADPSVLEGIGRAPWLAGRRCRLIVLDDGTVALQRSYPAGRARDVTARVARRLRARLRDARRGLRRAGARPL